jgi:enoyl-[acyl-carrier protein] reductase II
MRTPICETIGIGYPAFQFGMGRIARAELAGAVSEAAGLGAIGAGLLRRRHPVRNYASRRREVVKYADEVRGLIEVTLDERVPVFISGLGSPKGAVKDAHASGIYVLSGVGAERHAQKAVAEGVDAIIVSGHDGGGHVGQSIGLIHQVKAAGEVVHDVVNEARRALARATGAFQPATDSPDS